MKTCLIEFFLIQQFKNISPFRLLYFLGLFMVLTRPLFSDLRPNVVLILADDLGYGDTSCYGAELIHTPRIDSLAEEGMKFTSAYTPSSICSPTRYSLLTGRYFWRSERHPPTRVLWPQDPLAIEINRTTLPSIFKSVGYRTAVIGKWHLGFGEGVYRKDKVDWSQFEIGPGPLDVGFDYFYGLAANVENQPKLYIENRSFEGRQPGDVVNLKAGQLTAWDPDRIWNDDEVAQHITNRAVTYIAENSGKGKPPFFLYFPTTVPHGPIVPTEKFRGISPAGPYGDFVQELDSQVGQIIDAIKNNNGDRETLIIFTSDNGAVNEGHRGAEYMEMLNAGHKPTGNLRGGKWSVYEGGFKVPFIVWWPEKIENNIVNTNPISLVDIFATIAEMLKVNYDLTDAEDSRSFFLQLIFGPSIPAARDHLIVQSSFGPRAILREGWKYVKPWNPPTGLTSAEMEALFREMENEENYEQLYDLKSDPYEQRNKISEATNMAQQLSKALQLNEIYKLELRPKESHIPGSPYLIAAWDFESSNVTLDIESATNDMIRSELLLPTLGNGTMTTNWNPDDFRSFKTGLKAGLPTEITPGRSLQLRNGTIGNNGWALNDGRFIQLSVDLTEIESAVIAYSGKRFNPAMSVNSWTYSISDPNSANFHSSFKALSVLEHENTTDGVYYRIPLPPDTNGVRLISIRNTIQGSPYQEGIINNTGSNFIDNLRIYGKSRRHAIFIKENLPEFRWQFMDSDFRLNIIPLNTGPLKYRWYQNEIAMFDQVGAELQIYNFIPESAGTYRVAVTDGFSLFESKISTVFVAEGLPVIQDGIFKWRLHYPTSGNIQALEHSTDLFSWIPLEFPQPHYQELSPVELLDIEIPLKKADRNFLRFVLSYP